MAKDQAAGGGRLWMGWRARPRVNGACGPACVDTRRTAKDKPSKARSGRVAGAGKRECGAAQAWLLRWQQSVSAGFCIACRSSVTEMTGNRMSRSTARATSCMRLSPWAHGASCSQRESMKAASRTQAKLRTSSIRRADSTSGKYVSDQGALFSMVHGSQ